MKILFLSVALLFFTGAQGRYFWQQDEPSKKYPDVDVITEVLLEGLEMVSDAFERLDFEGIAKDYQIKEKMDAVREHTRNFGEALYNYYDKLREQFDQKLHKKFPVFRNNVVPILKEFDQHKKIAEQIEMQTTNLLSGMYNSLESFLNNLKKIAEKGSDGVHAEIESLRTKLQPYVDEEFQMVEKKMEEIKEHAKPHIEKIRNKFQDREDILEAFVKLFKEYGGYILSFGL
ncbi:uncharacterized protein [Engystomops pustulosus]|uniref:uncharacterized protein n=1 Tax=Engystomops pustulosus TaxID=76066 RepID=UPI003AFB602E